MRIPQLSLRIVLLCATIGAAPHGRAQSSASEIASVQLSAAVQVAPPRITLSWVALPTATGYTVYRKLRTATSWGSSIATLGSSATGHQDNGPAVNTLYEYKVVRTSSQGTGYGYICSGIEVAPVEYYGKLVLLVDNTFTSTLASELAQLESDLKGDGWTVIRHDVSPGATVPSVRNLVIADYNADPTNVKAVYSVGHVPVPYSGDIAPDGHDAQHKGAWPCDAYYGEINGTWTDNTVNNVTGWDPNKNIPGDGKFDQNSPPNTVELQVGRVDLGDLPTLNTTHTQRLSAYLTRAHDFKAKNFTPLTRGIIFDHLQDVTEPLSAAGWMSIAPLVGPANITEVPFNSGPWLKDLVDDQSYLWTFGSGGGLVGNDNGVITFYYLDKILSTPDLNSAGLNWGGVFNMMYGSYIGDWNGRDDVLRALLANGQALSNVYTGEPHFWFHTMGMGENIGSCIRLTMNNVTLYVEQSGGFINPAPRSALGLMGDPTLRQFNVSPPINLTVTNNASNASFSWSAAEGSPAGYHVYKFSASGVPVRVNGSLIAGTSYNSAQAYEAGAQYMVRAAKLETSSSGSYWNLSLGAQATASASVNVLVSPRVLLEGPYDGGSGLMNDDLRTAGLIPLAEPYTALGFAQVAGGGGETVSQSVLNTAGDNAIVDWVRVELRASGAPGTVVATRQGLLQRDGDVVAADGTSPLSFGVSTGNYHVAARHRNHLGAMTANAIALSGSATLVDLKGTSLATFGTNALKTIGAVRALWTGNAAPDNQLKYTGSNNDRDPILTRVGGTTPTNTVPGYFPEDTNLSGVVKYTGSGNDRDPILVNVGGTTPTNTRLEQLP